MRRSTRRSNTPAAIVRVTETLETRSLLTAISPVIQIDNVAPEFLGELNSEAVLYVEDSGTTRLYSSDGTQAGTNLIATINGVVDKGVAAELVSGNLYFAATGLDGTELWKTDGKSGGTFQLVDLNPGTANSSPNELTSYNGLLYFAATTVSEGRELYRTDGTAAGTQLAEGSLAGTDGLSPKELFVYDNVLFYSSTSTLDLYRSDGTVSGTSLFVEGTWPALPEGDRYTDVGSYVVGAVNGRLIVQRVSGSQYSQVRDLLSYESASDTSPDVLVRLYSNGNYQYVFVHFANSAERLVLQSTLHYTYQTRQWPLNAIWESDGTHAGTVMGGIYSTPTKQTNARMPGAFRNNTMFTTLANEELTDAVLPDNFYYGVPASVGAVATGDKTYLIDESAGVYTIRAVNDTNFALDLVYTSSTAISEPVVIFGELYFKAHDGSGTALWKVDENAQLDTGPTITSPAAASQHTGHNVQLTWNAVTGAANYDVRVTSLIGGAETLIASVDATTSTTVTVGIDPGDITVSVRARMTDDSVTDWSRVQFTNSVLSPTVLSLGGLAPGSQVAEANPLIEWSAVEGAISYEVWIAQDGDYFVSGISTGTSIRTSELLHNGSIDPFSDGSKIRIWVRANFASGVKSGWSANRDFYKVSDGFHTPVRAVSIGDNGALPEFTWSPAAVAGATVTSHEIFINKVGNRTTPVYQRKGLTAATHQVETPLSYGSYEIWVRVFYSDGSKTRWGRAPLEYGYAVPVPQLQAGNYNSASKQLTVTWDSTDSSLTYDLYVAPGNNVSAFVVYERNLTSTTFTMTTADVLVGNHRIWVRAKDAVAGYSIWSPSDELVFNTDGTGITVTFNDGDNDTTPAFEWAAVQDAVNYEITVERPSGNPYTLVLQETYHEVTEILSAGQYTVSVKAIFQDTSTTPVGSPTVFTVQDNFPNQSPVSTVANNVAQWDVVDRATRYELWVNEVDSNGRTILARAYHNTNIQGTLSQDLSLPSGIYRAWLRAFSSTSTASSHWSAAVNFTVALNDAETRKGESDLTQLGQVLLTRLQQLQTTESGEVSAAAIKEFSNHKNIAALPTSHQLPDAHPQQPQPDLTKTSEKPDLAQLDLVFDQNVLAELL